MDMIEKIKLAEQKADELKKNATNEVKSLLNNTDKNSKDKVAKELSLIREQANNLTAEATQNGLRKSKMFLADRKRFDNGMMDDACKNKKEAISFVLNKILG